MKIAARRFPDSIVRRRRTAGYFDNVGRPVEGTVTETTHRASVQPLALEDVDLLGGGGVQAVERLKCYIPEPDALSAAFQDNEADEVVLDGRTFVVEEVRSWRGSHTRATLLRET